MAHLEIPSRPTERGGRPYTRYSIFLFLLQVRSGAREATNVPSIQFIVNGLLGETTRHNSHSSSIGIRGCQLNASGLLRTTKSLEVDGDRTLPVVKVV